METYINSVNTLHQSNLDYEAIIDKIREDNNKLISVFIHELRNPLALMDSTIQYMETIHPEAKEFKYWGQLHELIQEMVTMTSDASILNKCYTLNKHDTNLLALLQSIVDNHMPKAEQNNVDLKLLVQPDCETFLSSYRCDANKIKHTISNLIKNAIEATSSGDFIHIQVTCLQEDITLLSRLLIQISNNGSPIPEEDIDRIFLPFVTFKKNGTGVGLALAKKIVELHYGSIHAESNENLTTFTISLPL